AEGQDLPPTGKGFAAEINIVTPRHLETMGIPLLLGRDFNETDLPDRPGVAIVNETFARKLWPGENPIGKRYRIGSIDSPLREVIGVAKDGKYRTLGESSMAYAYRPLSQAYRS